MPTALLVLPATRSAHRVLIPWSVAYGCINIQSVNNKFDDVMDMFRSHQLRHTVLGLTETWHDTDCAAFGRFCDVEFS